MSDDRQWTDLEVAIVGMAGRFPGADDVDALWENLAAGVEAVRFFDDGELDAAGVPEALRRAEGYVPAGAVLDRIEDFDARFFGLGPREAEILDPQHRLFLEWAWEALEDAGVDPSRDRRAVGVWGGTDVNSYMLFHLMPNTELLRLVGATQLRHSNRPDTLATRVAYHLDLTGPAITVQTTCSTSLVAVHLACQSLLNGECDLALAGGVSVDVAQGEGYLARRGGVLSPDGHVRAFDADAAGMIAGNGGGVVALKRLADALEEGDRVLAVIKGSAINNDGARKVSYSAPGVDGQARVVRTAQVVAEVEPDTIGYVEAHGTGTRLGDPIEVAALTRAFRAATNRTGFCALGSIKTNIGHLDAGAGIAGLIKTVQALRHRQIPPSLNYRQPNPEIDFESSPFRVATELTDWQPRGGAPRRAGVSSLGIGGTNAHVILEEAPEASAAAPASRDEQLLVVSARTPAALVAAAERLAARLRRPVELPREPAPALAEVAWTLATGRMAHDHRTAVVATGAEEAARVLAAEGDAAAHRIAGRAPAEGVRTAAFLFPGQGTQYPNMGRGLYETEEVFRREVDRCAGLLAESGELAGDGSLLDLLYPAAGGEAAAAEALARTGWTQPALFTVEWALARQLAAWGVEPAALLGHSIGEYVAATLAGVFALPEALALVAARGRMMEALPGGAMLSVPLGEAALGERLAAWELTGEAEVAAVNAPELTTVSGPPATLDELARRLEAEGVEVRRLHTSHAFHSAAMDPILDAFAERVARVPLAQPELPFVSNLSGTWITPAEATSAEYWARHLRGAVRFADGVAELAAADRVLVEVGPGRTLASLARRQQGADGRPLAAVTTLRHPRQSAEETGSDTALLLAALGFLWCAGVEVGWEGLFAGAERRRVGLPTYPFQRQRYWIDSPGRAAALAGLPGATATAPAVRTGTAANGETAAPAATGGVRLHDRSEGLSTVFVEPRDATEGAIAGVWETLLGIAGIGAFDDFFELGGHSLLATQVLSRVRDEFRVELPLEALFDAPTPAALAALVEERRSAGDGLSAPPLVARPRSEADSVGLPLSFAQQRLWVLHRLEPEGDAYNVPLAVRLEGELDRSVLCRVLDEVVRRHEVLRTRFVEDSGEPRQVIGPPAHQPIRVVDVTHLPDGGRDAETRRIAALETRRPFDLATGPLQRATLVHRGAGDHVAVLVMHHVITDGWSLGILVREIGTLYAAYAEATGEGRTAESPLAPLPVQYADYAAWQRDWLQGEVLAEKVSWWRDQLGEDPPVARLPLDRPRTSRRTWGGAVARFELGADTTAALQRFGREQGATLFMSLLAAFEALLARYSGQDDLYVGTPIAGRSRSEVEDLIGFFVNTLVLRTDLTGSPSFTTLVERVRRASLGAHAHQEVPFERLVEELVNERSLAHTPLFQVFFVLQNLPAERLELPRLTLSGLPAEQRSAKFDLSLEMEERDGGVMGTLEYATDLFDAATAERMTRHLRRLLATALAEPERPVAELTLLDAAEREQVVHAWNDTAVDFAPEEAAVEETATLDRLVLARAAVSPEAVAVLDADGTPWTYRRLQAASATLAARLAGHGAGPDRVVALLAERSPQALAALLAVLRAGAAFLPVDPSTPDERLRHLLDDSGAVAALSTAEHAGRLAAAGADLAVIRLDEAASDEAPAADFPSRAAGPASAAWVIYTSGSTGRPKGVVVSHGAATNHARGMARRYRLTADDRVLQFASLAFDAAMEEIFPVWAVGGTVVLRRDAASLDLREMERQVAEQGVTVLDLPTAYWHEWVGELEAAGSTPPAPVRLVVVGTEAARPQRVAAWARLAPGVEWVNAYGPSEATVTATVWPAAAGDDLGEALGGTVPPVVPIGQPVANVTAHVLDRGLGPVPVGLPGELVLGGAGLARGYLGRPARTAASFVPDPFSDRAGARLYRTGDLARRLDSADLEFLGRVDRQVKVRGFRIELGEVESALAALPGVAEARVLVSADATADRHLVGFVTGPAEGGEGGAAADRLLTELGRRLPTYMVPTALVVLDEMPVNASGKVDRRALEARLPETAGGRSRAPYVAPRDEREEALAAIWRDVLGVERVGADDDFFDLGGHSLKATQVIARVRRDLGVELPLRNLFERPTLAGLAAFLEEAERAAADAAPDPTPTGGAEGEAALRAALARLDELSEDEVRALLEKKQAALEGATR